MAVNQSQVDHIITAASEDDPEVKLQNLEREVDLIKTSIKRLLMDIRERMNELDNPFKLSASGGATVPDVPVPSAVSEVEAAKKSAMEAREAALDARESQLDATNAKIEADKKTGAMADKPEQARPVPAGDNTHVIDEQVLALLRSQTVVPQKNPVAAPASLATPGNEKLRLQKVYKLFKWTSQSVKKFGHDRLEIILESYRAMGYITKESCDDIREISRLMPVNLGEEHEVGPDEFVAELYALNRILTPGDTSLDRDMIEVMMEKRNEPTPVKETSSGKRLEFVEVPIRETLPGLRKKDKNDEWMNLPDRI
jgi:hypothetical protein